MRAWVKAATATVGGSGVDDDRRVVSCSSVQETERRRANLAIATGPVRVASSETKEMNSGRRDRRRWRGDCRRPSSSRLIAGTVQAGEARAVARPESNPRFEPNPNRSINPLIGSFSMD